MLRLNLIHISEKSPWKHVVRYAIGIAVDVLMHNYTLYKVRDKFSICTFRLDWPKVWSNQFLDAET